MVIRMVIVMRIRMMVTVQSQSTQNPILQWWWSNWKSDQSHYGPKSWQEQSKVNTTKDFAGHTSIHGIGYIFDQAMGVYDRLLWLAVCYPHLHISILILAFILIDILISIHHRTVHFQFCLHLLHRLCQSSFNFYPQLPGWQLTIHTFPSSFLSSI